MLSTKFTQFFSHVNQIFENSCYAVGGSVRDQLLDIEAVDYDFATPLIPDKVEKIIRGNNIKPYLIGKRFGTIGFKLPHRKTHIYIEITTFRGEVYKPKNRQPTITFSSSIEEDLARRDFTMNAVAISPKLEIIDPYNGQQDIQNRIIRAVGEPTERFNEDPLRMLRAIRFATTLNFAIEEKTKTAIEKNNYDLLNISKERWVQELDKIIGSNCPARCIKLLFQLKCIEIMIPEINLLQYNQELFHKFLQEIDTIDKNNLNKRWARLLKDTSILLTKKYNTQLNQETAHKICNYLKFSKSKSKEIIELIK